LGKGGQSQYDLAPLVSPGIDVSLDWPLDFVNYNGDFVAGAGTNTIVLPLGSGRARRWFFLSPSIFPVPIAPPPTVQIIYYRDSISSTNLVILASYEYDHVDPSFISMIGGRTNITLGRDVVQEGIQPVYVATPNALVIRFLGMVGAELVALRGLALDVDRSYPLPNP